nr:RNA exonuclease 1 homolog [Manis javanica]
MQTEQHSRDRGIPTRLPQLARLRAACPPPPPGAALYGRLRSTCSPRTSSRRTVTRSRTLGGQAAPSSSRLRRRSPRTVSRGRVGLGCASGASMGAVRAEGRPPDAGRPGPHSLLQDLLPLWRRVPRVALGPLRAGQECSYHWGRLRRNRVAGGWETQYLCCLAAVGSTGCQVAKQHVQDGRKENLEGFVKTFDKELSEDAHPGIFALDCEMSYTTYGLELTRVTVVDTDMHVVYDTFVKPDNEIVDYNTRFSGVTEADLADTSITLRDVQAVLLSMFSADTILIGHSLESDLLALKAIPSTVVDTALLFPHRLGLPYKRSLRTLMTEYLRQTIQDNMDGHSSSEDAAGVPAAPLSPAPSTLDPSLQAAAAREGRRVPPPARPPAPAPTSGAVQV